MAVRSTGQPGDRQRNDGLDAGLEILQAPVADRMLGRRQRDGVDKDWFHTTTAAHDIFIFFFTPTNPIPFSLYPLYYLSVYFAFLVSHSKKKMKKWKSKKKLQLLVYLCPCSGAHRWKIAFET